MTRSQAIILFFIAGLFLSSIMRFVLPVPVQNGAEYSDIARYISYGMGYIGSGFFRYSLRPTSFVAPLYTTILGLNYFLFGEVNGNNIVLMLQGVAFSLTAVLLYLISEMTFQKYARITPLFFLFYLPIYLPVYAIWDTCFFVFSTTLIVYLYLRYFYTEEKVHLERAAICLGGAMLLNAVSFVLLPVILLHLFIYKRFRIGLKQYLLVMAVPLLIISPWTVRNYIVHKHFVPIRTGIGLNLYLGNNPAATGTVILKVDSRLPKNVDEGINHNIFNPMVMKIWKPQFYSEIEEDNYLLNKAREFIFNNPRQFAVLCLKKFYYFWWKNGLEKDPAPVLRYQYAILLFFAIVGIYKTRLKNPSISLFCLIFAAFSMVYTITGPYFNWRYRFPLEPLMIILAVSGAVLLGRRRGPQ